MVEVNISVEEANANMKAAVEAKLAADRKVENLRLSELTPEQQDAYALRIAAGHAETEAKEAATSALQGKAQHVLERKIGRSLRPGEYARWVSGDLNNLRPENLELCSAEILAIEKRTGRHINDEELAEIEEAAA